jgi:hypothetical protein
VPKANKNDSAGNVERLRGNSESTQITISDIPAFTKNGAIDFISRDSDAR